MSFRILGKKEFLVPRFYDKRLSSRSFVKGNLNCYGLEWVKKPLWILEVNMNDPEYIYSRRVFYVDAENRLYSIMYEEVYNQKGELFKSQYIINPFYYEPITNFATLLSSIYYNNQTGHSTTLCLDPMTDHLSKVFTPAKNYTFKGLLRLAR